MMRKTTEEESNAPLYRVMMVERCFPKRFPIWEGQIELIYLSTEQLFSLLGTQFGPDMINIPTAFPPVPPTLVWVNPFGNK